MAVREDRTDSEAEAMDVDLSTDDVPAQTESGTASALPEIEAQHGDASVPQKRMREAVEHDTNHSNGHGGEEEIDGVLVEASNKKTCVTGTRDQIPDDIPATEDSAQTINNRESLKAFSPTPIALLPSPVPTGVNVPLIPKSLPRLRLSFSRNAAKDSKKADRGFVFLPNESFTLSPSQYYEKFQAPYLERDHLVPAYPALTESEELSIELLELTGSGSLSDGYRGVMRRRGGIGEPGVKVVVKVTCPSGFARYGLYSQEEGLQSVRNELELYCTNLTPIQGEVVPVFYGLWQMTTALWGYKKRLEKKHGVYVAVLEDAGDPLFGDIEDGHISRHMYRLRGGSMEKKLALHALYVKLGLAGVHHSGMKPIHTRVGPDGKGRLIDFEKASVRVSRECVSVAHSVGIRYEVGLAVEKKLREERKNMRKVSRQDSQM